MSKASRQSGNRVPASAELGPRPRPKGSVEAEPNDAFLRAFADALRDILREEHRLTA